MNGPSSIFARALRKRGYDLAGRRANGFEDSPAFAVYPVPIDIHSQFTGTRCRGISLCGDRRLYHILLLSLCENMNLTGAIPVSNISEQSHSPNGSPRDAGMTIGSTTAGRIWILLIWAEFQFQTL